LGFGSQSAGVSSWSTVAAQHVKIQVFNNSAAWTLKAYTKNFDVAPSTSDWGYSYGGLIGSTTSAKIPLAWRASTTTATAAPAFGDPSVSSTTATFGWTFFKDYWDADDPGQADDQSFAAAQGYITVAYGSAGGTNVVAKKQNVTTASALATPTSVFRLYLEGNFAGAPAGTYNQTAPPGGASKNKLQLDLDYN
jgi:hypothetical protein